MAVRRVGTDDECRREEESMVLAAERGSARREEPSSEWPVTSEERTVSQPAPLAVLMAGVRGGDGGEVRACLERLAPLQREVLDRVMGGHTNHEIAEELGIPEGRVRCVKFRALRRMQQLLRRFGHRPLSGVDSPATSGADEPAGG